MRSEDMPCGIVSGVSIQCSMVHGCNAWQNCKLTVEQFQAWHSATLRFKAAQLAELQATVATATADVESIQDDVILIQFHFHHASLSSVYTIHMLASSCTSFPGISRGLLGPNQSSSCHVLSFPHSHDFLQSSLVHVQHSASAQQFTSTKSRFYPHR